MDGLASSLLLLAPLLTSGSIFPQAVERVHSRQADVAIASSHTVCTEIRSLFLFLPHFYSGAEALKEEDLPALSKAEQLRSTQQALAKKESQKHARSR